MQTSKPWWQSVKLWSAVIAQLVSIASLVMLAIGIDDQAQKIVLGILSGLGQVASIILGAMWGNDYGTSRTEIRLQ